MKKDTTRFLISPEYTFDEEIDRGEIDYTVFKITCYECGADFYIGEDTDVSDFRVCPACLREVI